MLLARGVGFEPTTISLTASRSATELPPNIFIEPFPSLTVFEKNDAIITTAL